MGKLIKRIKAKKKEKSKREGMIVYLIVTKAVTFTTLAALIIVSFTYGIPFLPALLLIVIGTLLAYLVSCIVSAFFLVLGGKHGKI